MTGPADGKTPEREPSEPAIDREVSREDLAAEDKPSHQRGIAAKTAKVVLVVFGIALALTVAFLLRHFLLVLFLAITLAAALFPVVSWLEGKRFPRFAAVVTPYVAIIVLLVLAAFLIVPPLVDQVSQLLDDLPSLAERFRAWATGVANRLGVGSGDQVFGRLSSEIGNLLPNVGGLLRIPLTVVRVIGDVAIIVVTSFLMLLERDRIRRWTLRFLPHARRQGFLDESEKSLNKVGRYVLGQLIVMAVIGLGTGLGMLILGIPFALPIGLLGFFGEIVPYIGPIIAGVPAAILGFIESPADGLIMTGWLIALQGLEGYVLSPLIQHKVLRVSPLAVVITVVASLALFGILGALVAVPFVAIADVVLQDVVFPARAGDGEMSGEE